MTQAIADTHAHPGSTPRRWWRHLAAGPWRLRRAFPPATLAAIERAIAASEARHGGELRFVVEAALDIGPLLAGQGARARALDVFSLLRLWDTERNTGVLVYVLLADRDVEIVADRGIARRVGDAAWAEVCARMERAFAAGRFEAGSLEAIEAITALLARHAPAAEDQGNELPDRPVVL